MDTDGDLSNLDRFRRLAFKLWPFFACAAAVGVLVMATIISVGAIRDRDQLKDAARDARSSALAAAEASAGNRLILERNKPCLPEDPADSPQCIRQRESDRVVADAIAAISREVVAAVQTQHSNLTSEHEAIRDAIERLRR